VAVVIAVTVQANLPAARVPMGDVRLGVLVARRQLPGAPCSGHEQVQQTVRPPAWTKAQHDVDSMLLGAADLAGHRCLIWIRSGLDRATTCKVVVHELDHWTGAADNEPGQPVMASTGILQYAARGAHVDGWPYAPCEVPR
jgi:hypothetical protein